MASLPSTSCGSNSLSNLTRKSSIVGPVDVAVSGYAIDFEISNCTEATVFITASLKTLTLKGLTRCTIVAAPCTVSVVLQGCTECVVSVAAPTVSALDLVGCLLFVAAKAPVSVAGASKDVRLGPYNVVGDGLFSAPGVREWTVGLGGAGSSGSSSSGSSSASGSSSGVGSGGSSGETFCRLDSGGAASLVRAVTPADFYWRYLPVPQEREERLPLPLAFATPEVPRLSTLDSRGPRAQRIEALTQMKFVVSVQVIFFLLFFYVVGPPPLFFYSLFTMPTFFTHTPLLTPVQNWMLTDTGKASSLKNVFRAQAPS